MGTPVHHVLPLDIRTVRTVQQSTMDAMIPQHARRLARARTVMKQESLVAIVVGTGSEMRYFTGHEISAHERLACLVITESAETLIAPATDVAGGWIDGEDPYALVVDKLPAGDIGVGSSLLAPHILHLQELIDGRMRPLPPGLFEIKEPEEIAELSRAGKAIDEVHSAVPDLLRAGRTEEEVAEELADLILHEHAAVDFVIVGSGENGANPHHDHSGRLLRPGDPVVVDLGGTLDSGYHSDCTRTYVVPGAEPPAAFLRAYEAVHSGFRGALQFCRPGVTASELDASARAVITAQGFGDFFSHRLGHGIGLAGHERPWIVAGDGTVVQEDMVFSVEPGVYMPGEWGVRIEDIVVATPEGALTLNNRPRELLLVT